MWRQFDQVVGWTVDRVCFDFEVGLMLAPGGGAGSCWITLMGAFALTAHGGDRHELQAGPPHAGAESIVALHGDSVTSLSASTDGALEVQFASGTSIECARDVQYESWSVGEPVSLLCSPHDGPPWND